eukprot:15427-Heterococcus_DN1.PRE.2
MSCKHITLQYYKLALSGTLTIGYHCAESTAAAAVLLAGAHRFKGLSVQGYRCRVWITTSNSSDSIPVSCSKDTPIVANFQARVGPSKAAIALRT